MKALGALRVEDGIWQRLALDVDREHGLPMFRQRDEGLMLGAKEGMGGQRIGRRIGGPGVARAALWMLLKLRVRADRPDETLPAIGPGDQACERLARCEQRRVVGDGRVNLGEQAPDLVLGCPLRGQADREPGDAAGRGVEHGEVLFEREREQPGKPPLSGQRA